MPSLYVRVEFKKNPEQEDSDWQIDAKLLERDSLL
jgi:hypothetical protein